MTESKAWRVDYSLNRLLSGHGDFQSLSKIGKALSSDCLGCNGIVNDSDHTFFAENGMEFVSRTPFRQHCLGDAERHYVRVLLVAMNSLPPFSPG